MGEYYPQVSLFAIPVGNLFLIDVTIPTMTTHHADEKKPARGGRLEDQVVQSTSAGETATELDMQIAQLVFGVESAATDAWPWGAPPFSTDRNWCAAVVGRMLSHPAADQFDAALERRALRWGWKSSKEYAGIATLILVLTPDEICNAALDAIEQFHCEAPSLIADTGHP